MSRKGTSKIKILSFLNVQIDNLINPDKTRGGVEVDIIIKPENSPVKIQDDAQDVLRLSKGTNKLSKSGNP